MFWFYVVPLLFSLCACSVFVWDGYIKKGFIQGDDFGMLLACFVPGVNIIVSGVIIWVICVDFFSKDRRYFEGKKK